MLYDICRLHFAINDVSSLTLHGKYFCACLMKQFSSYQTYSVFKRIHHAYNISFTCYNKYRCNKFIKKRYFLQVKAMILRKQIFNMEKVFFLFLHLHCRHLLNIQVNSFNFFL